MTETIPSDVLIIGAGPAGYTAAIYAARANLAPVLVAGLQPGGQLTITTDVENYPGFAQPIQGPWLMEQMAEQAAHVGTRIIFDIITEAPLRARDAEGYLTLTGDSGDRYRARSVIIATGAQARWLAPWQFQDPHKPKKSHLTIATLQLHGAQAIPGFLTTPVAQK